MHLYFNLQKKTEQIYVNIIICTVLIYIMITLENCSLLLNKYLNKNVLLLLL